MKKIKQLLIVAMFIAVAQGRGDAQRVTQPRILPVPASEMTEIQRRALGRFYQGADTPEVFRTCVRNVELCRTWNPFADHIMAAANSVPARERELLILRAAWLSGSDYQWDGHARIGKRAGLSDEEILRIAKGPDAPGWSKFDSALLHAADELHQDQFITDTTWRSLRERFTDAQLIDAIFTVGEYTMVAGFLNSVGIHAGPGSLALPK